LFLDREELRTSIKIEFIIAEIRKNVGKIICEVGCPRLTVFKLKEFESSVAQKKGLDPLCVLRRNNQHLLIECQNIRNQTSENIKRTAFP